MDKDGKIKREQLLHSASESAETGVLDTSTERRSTLRTLSGIVTGGFIGTLGFSRRSTATGAGETATGTADIEVARRAAEKYRSPRKISRAFRSHASNLLQRLERDGHIERGTVSALATEKIHDSVESYVHADEGVLINATVSGGTPHVKIQVKYPLPGTGEIIFVVDPSRARSQAFFKGNDGEGHPSHYTSTRSGDGDVTVQSCDEACGVPETYCGTYCNKYDECGCANLKVYDSCTDLDCVGCYLVDYDCSAPCNEYTCS